LQQKKKEKKMIAQEKEIRKRHYPKLLGGCAEEA
jgi:hypothetical protein